MRKQLSVNRLAWKLLEELCEKHDFYRVNVEKTSLGTLIIDAGVKAEGGFQAGRIITEICMGGCGKAELLHENYDEMDFPSIFVYTDHPIIATLASQFAGWRMKNGDFFAIGSGPARALALKPKEIYKEIGYRDNFEKAVLVLEAEKHPPEKLIRHIAEECEVPPENLALILTPTTSVTGATQISARVIETGIHKLNMLGLEPNNILHAWGYAPIPPVHPEFKQAMARTNDAVLYGGKAYYIVDYEDEEKLKQMMERVPSKASMDYGKPFLEIFKEANYDFYKIDSNIFAPAVIIVNNVKTGNVFRAGEINTEILRKSLGFHS